MESFTKSNPNGSCQDGVLKMLNTFNMDVTSSQSSRNSTIKNNDANGEIIKICVEILLGIIICFGNGLVITSYVRFKALRTVANFFIVNLAIADFCVGIMMPLHVAMYIYPTMLASSIYVCLLRYMLLMLSVCASLLSLFGITVDRYIAIVVPLRYKAIMTRKNAYLLAGSIWGLPFMYTIVLPLFYHRTYDEFTNVFENKQCTFVQVLELPYLKILCTVFFFILLGTMILMYIRIFYDVHRFLKSRPIVVLPDVNNENIMSKPKMRHIKLLGTTFIVFGCFIASWGPFLISLHAQMYFDMMTNPTWESAREYSTFLGLLNSAINPMIYAFRHKNFKMAFKSGLCMGHEGQLDTAHRESIATIGNANNNRKINIQRIS
ncbi:unnamed protein product [Owenia fusiformis]|uniref:Uncharacterized protein n=1 Tax=Owenia fusiformis TaxID=6347 RepID=A0A8J1U3S1_OWEFU|nr:unnamed protein product [Owenia fusiformis]